MSNVQEVLNDAAAEAAKPTKAKKVRTPKTEGAAEEKAPKAPRAPKLVPVLDEAGEPVLDDNGEPVMQAAPKKARTPKLDAEGNPIVRQTITSREGDTIHLNMEKIAKYRGARHDNTKHLEDGITVGDFFAAGGDPGFLRFYVRDGAVTLSAK